MAMNADSVYLTVGQTAEIEGNCETKNIQANPSLTMFRIARLRESQANIF